MPQPTPWPVRAERTSWKSQAAGLLLAVLSLLWIALGLLALVIRFRQSAGPWLAPAALVLIASGAWQAQALWRLWRASRLAIASEAIVRPAFWCWLATGVVSGYLAALIVGPVPHVAFVWLAVVALWECMLLLPLAAPPKIVDDWRRWLQDRTPRRLAWLVYAPLLVFVAGEAALRIERVADESNWAAGGVHFEEIFTPSAALADAPFDLARIKPGRFRVAVLGDDAGDQPEQLCRRVAGVLPGAEIIPLSVSRLAPDAEVRLSAEIEKLNPDLVLAVLPVCEDLSREPAARHPFDWRQLELAALVVDERTTTEPAPVAADDYEGFLRELGPQLVACRTPIDEQLHARWQRVYASLDDVMTSCHSADVPLALVVVPSEFQVNAELRETLLRRNGLAAEQFDVELPQRRLAGYAQHRKLPLIDLLPHLRLCREAVYQRNATVLNAEGNTAAASAIGGWLHSRYGGHLTAQLSKAPQRN